MKKKKKQWSLGVICLVFVMQAQAKCDAINWGEGSNVFKVNSIPDMAILESSYTNYEGYAQVPILINPEAILQAKITNTGSSDGNFSTYVTIMQNGVLVYQDSIVGTLTAGDTAEVLFDNYMYSDTGQAIITYDVVSVLDSNNINNKVEHTQYISTNKIARDNGVSMRCSDVSPANGGFLASLFTHMPTGVKLKEAECIIDPNGTGNMSGLWVRASILSVTTTSDNRNAPFQKIAITDSILINGPGPHAVKLPIVGGALDVESKFAIAVEQIGGEDYSLCLGISADIHTRDTDFISYEDDSNWLALWFDFPNPLQIRAIISETNTHVEELDEIPKLVISPNPAHEIFNVSFSGIEGEKITVLVRNSLGQEVYNKKVNTQVKSVTLSAQKWAIGTYTLTLIGDNVMKSEKLIKN